MDVNNLNATIYEKEGNIYKVPIQVTVADHDAQDNAEIKEYGIFTKEAKKDVSVGIQKVAERLVVQKDGRPRLFIFNNCSNLISEIGKYRWQESKEGRPVKEEPLKIDDHACDALRYMIMELDFGSRYVIIPDWSASDLGL